LAKNKYRITLPTLASFTAQEINHQRVDTLLMATAQGVIAPLHQIPFKTRNERPSPSHCLCRVIDDITVANLHQHLYVLRLWFLIGETPGIMRTVSGEI
jgi:hypothetical protein